MGERGKVQLDISLGNVLEMVVFAGGCAGVIWRGSGIAADVRALATAVAKLEPHGVTVPLLQQQVQWLITEVTELRKQKHDQANTMQWIVGRLEEIAPREPSRPDLNIERDPRRR